MLSDPLLNLGRVHWHLLYADKLLHEKMFEPTPPGKISPVKLTDFGREIENDVINWWVFKREHDLPVFRKKTMLALQAAQTLKDNTQILAKGYFQSLDEVIQTYENFVLRFDKDISAITEYVQWLFKKDEFAPAILFNYRTWGSTRMSDRANEVDNDSLNDHNVIEALTMIVLGLTQDGIAIVDIVKQNIESNLFDSIKNNDPQSYAERKSRISTEDIQKLAAAQAADFFAEYFEHIRDSLRNVQLVIEQRETQERLLTSDDFWRSFILKAAQSAKTEQKYWDFKQTLDMWQAAEPRKSKKAHKFSEIVAGFANNAGGVIIVGVTDDPPRQIIGLGADSGAIENFMKHTQQVIGKYIDHTAYFVNLHQVSIPDVSGKLQLCLVIAISQTSTVLSVKEISGNSLTYPFREETGLVRKDQNSIKTHKVGVKCDNFDFLGVLQQFLQEDR